MRELPVLSGREVIKILSKRGFRVIRQRGSHIRLEKIDDTKTIRITVPDHKELKRKTLGMIIKTSGLSIEEFKKYL